MQDKDKPAGKPLWHALVGAVITTVYVILLLKVEDQNEVIGLLVAGAVVVLALTWSGHLSGVGQTLHSREGMLNLLVVLGVLVVAVISTTTTSRC